MNDKIQKVVNLYEASYDNFKGVFVYKNLEPMDTDFASINFIDNVFYFEFGEDEIEDFQIKVENIKHIGFDIIGDMTVTVIVLNNCDTVLINNF